jgi:DNA mismatch repair protein MutS2
MESEEAGTRLALREAEDNRDALDRRLEQMEEERQRILDEAREQAQAEIEAMQAEIRQARKRLRDVDSINQLKKLNKQVEEIEETQFQALAPVVGPVKVERKRPSLQIGDTVQVKSLNVKGEVISISKKEALVAVGRLQMRAKLDDLLFKGRQIEEEPEKVYLASGPSVNIELDIRGRRVEDGLAELERYIDSAFLSRMPWVRIIHGKGTGKLREAVRKALRKNQHVSSWEEGKDGEGGAGVTVAKLVKQG